MLYTALIDYFKVIASHRSDIAQHYHGDYEEILAAATADITYPVMWTETPEMIVERPRGGVSFIYEGHISILDSISMQERYTEYQPRLKALQPTAIGVLLQMMHEHARDTFALDGKYTRIVPIEPSMIDNLVGWRIEYRITADPSDLTAYCGEITDINI